MKQRKFGRKLVAAVSAATVLGAGAGAWAWLGERQSSTAETLANNTPVWITRTVANAPTDARVPTDGSPFDIYVTVHNDDDKDIYMAVFPEGHSRAYTDLDDGFFCPANTIITDQVAEVPYQGLPDNVTGDRIIEAGTSSTFTLTARFVDLGIAPDPDTDQTECQGETLEIDFGTLTDGGHYGDAAQWQDPNPA